MCHLETTLTSLGHNPVMSGHNRVIGMHVDLHTCVNGTRNKTRPGFAHLWGMGAWHKRQHLDLHTCGNGAWHKTTCGFCTRLGNGTLQKDNTWICTPVWEWGAWQKDNIWICTRLGMAPFRKTKISGFAHLDWDLEQDNIWDLHTWIGTWNKQTPGFIHPDWDLEKGNTWICTPGMGPGTGRRCLGPGRGAGLRGREGKEETKKKKKKKKKRKTQKPFAPQETERKICALLCNRPFLCA